LGTTLGRHLSAETTRPPGGKGVEREQKQQLREDERKVATTRCVQTRRKRENVSFHLFGEVKGFSMGRLG